MIIARTLFVSSALFALGLALSYWSVTHEPAGSTLLAFMAAALLVVAGYMFFAERDAALFGDRPDAVPADAAGERVGTYVTRSAAPLAVAIALSAIALGLVASWAGVGLGIVAVLFFGAVMIVRSR